MATQNFASPFRFRRNATVSTFAIRSAVFIIHCSSCLPVCHCIRLPSRNSIPFEIRHRAIINFQTCDYRPTAETYNLMKISCWQHRAHRAHRLLLNVLSYRAQPRADATATPEGEHAPHSHITKHQQAPLCASGRVSVLRMEQCWKRRNRNSRFALICVFKVQFSRLMISISLFLAPNRIELVQHHIRVGIKMC